MFGSGISLIRGIGCIRCIWIVGEVGEIGEEWRSWGGWIKIKGWNGGGSVDEG